MKILMGGVKFIAMPFVALVFAIAVQGELSAAQAALVLYYPFNGDATDASGNGHDGTVFGAVPAADRYGTPNSAYSFDGVSAYIRASATGLPTAERTVALWFYTSTVPVGLPAFVPLGYGGGSCGTSWFMGLGNGTQYVAGHCNAHLTQYLYGSMRPQGAWYHWAITTDASGTKIYLNGVLVATSTEFFNDTAVTGTDLAIGVDVNSSGGVPYTDPNVTYFKGLIDEVRIYDQALTADEIRVLAGVGVVGNGTAASCTDAALNTALSGGGLVTFNCGPGALTIDISSAGGGTGTKTISTDTTIDGGGLITISGGNSVGVFSVNTNINFTVENLTIANGNTSGYGGGIYNNFGGTLTVTNSTFSGNSVVVGGGGIYNYGTLAVTNSTFSGNSAGEGGGIYNECCGATLAVTNSTFSGNSAGGPGGGIMNSGGTLAVTNSTFSGNSAPSGSYGAGGYGGGISNGGGPVTVTNTIVANSTSGGNCGGNAVTDGGQNIDDGATCGFTGTGCTITSGSSFCSTNPQLAAGLASNGGPTQTIALQVGSPAINAGDETVCAAPPVNNLDQRGFVRPGTGTANCSIGAFEANSTAPDGTICTSSGQCSHGQCVDGICCGPACTGTCQSCAAAKTGLANGTCGEVTEGLQTTNSCNGTNACNGAGTCLLAGEQPCSSGSQCASNSCVASTCLQANGQTCSISSQCGSGSCVGGRCGALGVPTLSQWGIILFSCLALGFVLWQTRGRLGAA